MTAQIANGGFEIKPRIVVDGKNDNLRNYLKHKNENPNEPLPTDLLISNFDLKPLFKNQEHINLIKDAMFSSSNEPGGTSYRHRWENKKFTFAGKTGSSQIKRFTELQRELEIKQKDIDTEKTILELERDVEFSRLEKQRSVDIKLAEEKAQTAKEEARKRYESEEAYIMAEEQIKNAKTAQQKNVDAFKIAAEQETRVLDIEKAKRIEIEEKQKQMEVLEKSKAVLKTKMEEETARAKAVEAEEKVNTIRDVEQAEKDKALGVIEASKNAEREKLASMAAKIRYEIEAAGKKALNEAENARSDASRRSALRQKLAEKIEGIIREWVRPMQNIDSIKVVDVNGLPGFSQGGGAEGSDNPDNPSATTGGYSKKGSLADNVVNSALRYRAQQPFLDSLLKEIGMSPGEASNIRNILGDYDDPKKDKHMRFDDDVKKNPKKK